ncbi:hypothetical protein MACH09_13800 [Vibrio sp. MACH09]|uniref:DUF3859 domain-containing protein n=1 Tax=unclassified Vibrio TaxID=2614977 RepID=UPI0014934FA1|nr:MULTISPECIES: DUF3859 domain-containing protein [unclassified Vibrio]NOI68527.1 DUF3859 domain-containing protein [Vibrio sp. 99-8-1]GLO60872.1 hypothetical protein MACH09_13800 [Vibrio sp. MACH09]
MAKRSSIIEMTSYGIYSTWDSKSKQLPKIQEFTVRVPAEVDIEFGFIINIKKAKGQKIQYCIYHPSITTEDGDVLEPFDGEEHINSNDWDFYLGDTIWLPVENKIGPWRMTVELNGKVVAEKTFELFARDEGEFWKRRGF